MYNDSLLLEDIDADGEHLDSGDKFYYTLCVSNDQEDDVWLAVYIWHMRFKIPAVKWHVHVVGHAEENVQCSVETSHNNTLSI